LEGNNVIEICNFFGDRVIVSREEVLEVIRPTIRMIAERISQEINLLNRSKPQAVILVGGGSLTPSLRDILAETIDLPRSRIGIQVRERLSGMQGEETSLTGSDVITPLGIGMTALNNLGLHYYSVSVNGLNIPLFDLQPATVADTLLAAGIQPKAFLARPGSALIFELNGQRKIIKGELGKPAEIYLNDLPAKLDQITHPGDRIKFFPGQAGRDAQARIKDVVSSETKKISGMAILKKFVL
jgi:hypothetical protein